MLGRSARALVEISHDPSRLDDGGFWAVSVDYEGRWTCAKFAELSDEEFAMDSDSPSWQGTQDPWQQSMSSSEYIDYVERIRSAIAQGELYQANACLTFTRRNEEPLDALFATLLANNPAPFATYLSIPGLEIASASPELFLEMKAGVEGREIKTSPIKGTSKSEDFLEKDYPENIMIVDLMRNDFGAICKTGSVETPRVLATEAHPGLFHLVSDVTGILREGISWSDISGALLPAGSISGAPKSSAIRMIKENEGVRGVYTGLIGWVQGEQCQLAVAIRTFWQSDEYLHFGAGAGITWGSEGRLEWEEVELKASRFLAIAGGEWEHE